MKPFLAARWEHLLMLNYEVEAAHLAPFVPRDTELDTYEGRHFISIVGFRFLDTRVRAITVPCHRNFNEVNLRFYVRRHEGGEQRRGVVFIKEVVPLRAVALVANWWYHEKYVVHPMTMELVGNQHVAYGWAGRRIAADIDGAPCALQPGSPEEFFAEHYWGYTRRRDGSTNEFRVAHPSWRYWPATKIDVSANVPSFYGPPFADSLARPPVSAFVADGSAVQVYPGRRLPS